MRLVYSYWSLPTSLDDSKQQDTKWLYAISVAYAKILGYETVLHTDKFGAEVLKSIPFDEVHLTMETLAADVRFWSYPKIAAIKSETAPFIHIDGDAWIKTPYLRDLLKNTEYDVAVQMTEDGTLWDVGYEPFKESVQQACDHSHLLWKHKRAYNTGILSFKNNELKELFVDTYESMMHQLRHHPEKSKLNVIVEQFNLYSLCVIGDYKVLQILDTKAQNKHFNEIANEIGFTHLWGASKWDPEVQQLVRNRLKEINEPYYDQVLSS
jgi:hypothetical protein